MAPLLVVRYAAHASTSSQQLLESPNLGADGHRLGWGFVAWPGHAHGGCPGDVLPDRFSPQGALRPLPQGVATGVRVPVRIVGHLADVLGWAGSFWLTGR